MLLTWDVQETHLDPNTNTRTVTQRPQGIVVPDCCPQVSNVAIHLRYHPEDFEESRFGTAKPHWVVGSFIELRMELNRKWTPTDPPQFCPYCGTKLPDVRRRADPPPNIHRPVGFGDYCGTCDKRANTCTCWYPEVAWETVPPEPSGIAWIDARIDKMLTRPLGSWSPPLEVEAQIVTLLEMRQVLQGVPTATHMQTWNRWRAASGTQGAIAVPAEPGKLRAFVDAERKARWVWPLQGCEPLLPDGLGSFGAIRVDRHTGVDLYCELGTHVVAVEDGEVTLVEWFTGEHVKTGDGVPSTWWNNTQVVIVRGASGDVAYGEVTPWVRVGDKVRAGQIIAVVDRAVLKKFKGRPMVMLHLELYLSFDNSSGEPAWAPSETAWWENGGAKPARLLDPTPHLESHACRQFDLSAYDGQAFRDPSAPAVASRWWDVWGGRVEDFLPTKR